MRLARTLATVVVGTVAAAGAPGVAGAQTATVGLSPSIDLRLEADAVVTGLRATTDGYVFAVDDVNGDSLGDVIARTDSGATVAFGPLADTVALSSVGGSGFHITGTRTEAGAVEAGDVNADGRSDVLIGAWQSREETLFGGSLWLVYGKTDSAGEDIDHLEPSGAVVWNERTCGCLTDALASLQDVNGDGRAEVLTAYSNSARVIFGGTYGPSGATTADGYALTLADDQPDPVREGFAGRYQDDVFRVASAGDVNRDGRTDMLVGVREDDDQRGNAYVVFGKASTATIDLRNLGSQGYMIRGAQESDLAGASVAHAGDVNGDGRADAIIGAPGAGDGIEGAAYVVFGRSGTSTVDLGNLGSGGFEIRGAEPLDEAGAWVSGGRDVNSDGLADVLVGAPKADNLSRRGSGSVYVVHGRRRTEAVDLGSLTDRGGYRIDGATTGAHAGTETRLQRKATGADGANVYVYASTGLLYLIDATPGVGPPPLTGVELTPRTYVREPVNVVRDAAARRGRITYTLSRPAAVSMRFRRRFEGRRAGGRGAPRCRPATRRRTRGRRCTGWTTVGELRRLHRQPGRQTIPFALRVGRRVLGAGDYRLEIVARDRAGRIWGPARIPFRVRARR